jgi:uncharacterized membrane protein
MDSLYLLLKLLHVLGAIAWIGGLLTLVVLNARMGREGDAAVLASLGRQSEYLGRTVLGPAMVVTLLAGFGTAGVARIPFTTPWIVWGIVGFVASIVIGVLMVQRAASALESLARSAGAGDPRIDAARGRLIALNAVNLLLLVSIVAAMVFKPTFS